MGAHEEHEPSIQNNNFEDNMDHDPYEEVRAPDRQRVERLIPNERDVLEDEAAFQ